MRALLTADFPRYVAKIRRGTGPKIHLARQHSPSGPEAPPGAGHQALFRAYGRRCGLPRPRGS
ncbi:protein of unknown function [Methylorubrum extorquens]|uniref:Uncharacterized protein n=1 Tax=Methylorubrum extorquens TaxID=408 RepID=A0A2N9AKF9_METEX|nr:protein of unknown function [Methylorubrum extorquens]